MKDVLKYKWFQLSSRLRLSPLPNIHSMEAVTSLMKKVVGVAYKRVLFIFKGNTFFGFFDENDYEKVGEIVLNKVKKDPQLFLKLVKRQKKLGGKFLKWLKKIHKKDLSRFSNKQIVGLYSRYLKEYRWIYANYFPILACEKPLIEHLKEALYLHLKDEVLIGEDLNVLISEPQAMVTRQEEIAALKIVVQIQKNKKWIRLFRLNNQRLERGVKSVPRLFNLVKKHEKKFFWLTRDYEDPILTFSDIIFRLKNHLKGNPTQKLNNYKKEFKNLIKKRKQVIRDLKLTVKEQALFTAMRNGLHLKELRKSIVSQSLYYFDRVLEEICQRTGLNLRQVRFFVNQDEVNQALNKRGDWNKILNERLRLSGYFISRGKTSVIVGKRAQKVFIKLTRIKKGITELKGIAAAPGKTQGIVRIVLHPKECKKVKRGDVIVAPQVLPAYSVCIPLATGLICDGGTGITSHPATLAREAKIPCVTGTKIATRILKDGDRVEVDGYKGIVKIIK